MSVYIPKFSSSSLGNATSPSYYNAASDSSAKKFISTDAIQNNDPTDSTHNTEHLIMAAAGVRSLSVAVQTIAAEARKQVSNAISAVLDSDAELDPQARKQSFQYTEEDVNSLQSMLGDAAAAGYNKNVDQRLLSEMSTRTQRIISDSRFVFVPSRAETSKEQALNSSVPQIENVLVDLDPRKGTVDAFYAGITFNLKTSDLPGVKLVRVFRAQVKEPVYTRPISPLSYIGVQKIGSQNNSSATTIVRRLNDNGVENAVDSLGEPNAFTGLPMAASADGHLIIPPPLAGQAVQPNSDPNVPEAFHHLDKSVIENINVLFNLQSNPVFGYTIAPTTSSMRVGTNVSGDLPLGQAQREQQRGDVAKSYAIVDNDNKLEFQEIAHFSPDVIYSQEIGDLTEFFFADDSVSYGGGYKYFIVSINDQMVQSVRSTVVDAIVEALRVPPRPTTVTATSDQKSISLTMIVDDQLVEKFEIHRLDLGRNPKSATKAEVISGQAGFAVEQTIREVAQNNFLLVGEVLNGQKSGASFLDTDVVPGTPYIYRVYSVDVFGNKSESPFEINAYVSDRSGQIIPLKAPSILAEVDETSKKIKITFSSNEPTIQRIRLERLDMTAGENEFSIPSSPSRVILGTGRSPLKNRLSLRGELLTDYDPSTAWLGFFQNTGAAQVFVDRSVQFDHVYQYRAYGEDRYGNKSSIAMTAPLLVNRKPLISSPVNLQAVVTWDSSFVIQGVKLVWSPGSLDVSAADKLGNQQTLAQSSVRTLYQVQRRADGQETWENFPLTEKLELFDAVEGVDGDVAPNFRPSFLKLNKMYHYRVQALQAGDFISNFTVATPTFTGFKASVPSDFVLRTPSTYRRPFFIMLNWGTPPISGIIDRWDIERAEVNNFAAVKLNLNNPESFNQISYRSFKSVYRESSRFSGRESDMVNNSEDVNTNVVVGQHYLMDTQVDFGNTYFYRIRAVDTGGNASGWVYKGMKLTSQAFENKWAPLYTDEEKKRLALSMQPQSLVNGSRKNAPSSMGLLPGYATPESARTTPRISYDVVPNSNTRIG